MVKLSQATRLAGPVDVATYGEYRVPDTPGPRLRFTGRITAEGEFTARLFRYHVYGGWFCPCHGSQYDTAGRIRKGPAPKNLVVPKYTFLTDTTIRIG